MATNLFFEARGEPYLGLQWVNQVVLNRVYSPLYPDTICEVVKQRYQFSWLNKNPIPQEYVGNWDWFMDDLYYTSMCKDDKEAWLKILKLSYSNYFFRSMYDVTDGSLYYMTLEAYDLRGRRGFNNTVVTGVIGDHIFFKLVQPEVY